MPKDSSPKAYMVWQKDKSGRSRMDPDTFADFLNIPVSVLAGVPLFGAPLSKFKTKTIRQMQRAAKVLEN